MRYCNHCKAPLLTKRGTPDYRKHFCGRDCKNADAKEKMAARRMHVHGRKCSKCGRRPPVNVGVSHDTAPATVDMNQPEEVAGTEFRLRSERPEEEVEVPQ